MNNRINILYAFLVLFVLCLASSCVKEDDDSPLPPPVETPLYAKGVLIPSEGQFGSGSGAVSFYDRETNVVENEIFARVNTESLGSVVQSVNVFQDKIFVVVNGANKVVQANAETFSLEGTITGLEQPRHFLGVDDDVSYVSQWGADGLTSSVAIVQTANLAIINTIPTPSGADKMLLVADKVWVLCSGGFGRENKVAIINIVKGEVVAEVEVRFAPRSITKDANGKIWVACTGNVYDENDNENGALIRINANTFMIEEILDLGSTVQDFNFDMVTNNTKTDLFYNFGGAIYRQPIGEATVDTTPFINGSNVLSLYGLSYDSVSNALYISDAKDFASDGEIQRYDADSGAFIDAFTVKVAPNGNCFFGE
ncbi:MAG: DUF5074 domain-containing protein [Chitinophagales bacterium]